MNLRVAASVVLWTAFTACESSTAEQAVTPSPVLNACEAPAPVVAAPAGTGLADGVTLDGAFLTASWRSNTDFQAGYPTKVPIHATDPVSLEGRRCGDGQPLRFWYHEGNPPLGALPASISKLETTGDLVAQFQPDSSPAESYTGYILFPTAGDYLLATGPPGSSGDLLVQAVVRVGSG